jgi:hypothetical protein
VRSNAIDSTTRDLIRGALGAWGTLDTSTFLKSGDRVGTFEIHDGAGRVMASIRREQSPIGPVWQVGLDNRRERVFPSVVIALRYLRDHICPEREASHVLFGQGDGR